MGGFFERVPKAELHLHLEGGIEPETLHELAPQLSMEEIQTRYRFADFPGFIESFKWVTSYLRGPADYALALRRLLERLAAQNVVYAEITLSAGVILWRDLDFAPIFDALRRECGNSSVRIAWILDAVRHFGAGHALEVARLAAERRDQGVVAFGIGGDELRGPAEWFTDVFRFARDAGLRLTAHAGETAGPESVRGALALGAERIGHGIRAIDDPGLPASLRERDIPLEICLSSNLATGAAPSLEQHPFRRLFDAGVPLTLATDDPAMFHTTLNREYSLAARFFSETELRGILENSFRYAFSDQVCW